MGFLLGVFTTLRALYLMLLPSIVIHRHNYHVLMTSDVISVKAVRGARGEGRHFLFPQKRGNVSCVAAFLRLPSTGGPTLKRILSGLALLPPRLGCLRLGCIFLGWLRGLLRLGLLRWHSGLLARGLFRRRLRLTTRGWGLSFLRMGSSGR